MSLSVPDVGIFATHVTWEDVEAELKLSLETTATLGENKSIKQIGIGYGFMSSMCLVEPDWQGDNLENLPSSFVLKIPSYLTMTEISSKTEGFGCFAEEERTKKQENNLRNYHNTEVVAFKIFERLNGGRISVPKVFASRSFTPDNRTKGFLALEYIKNTTTMTFSDDLSVEQALQVFRNVSYLQSMTPGLQDEETAVFTKNMYAYVASDIFTPAMKSKYLSDLLLLENGYFADIVPQATQLFDEVLCMKEYVDLDNLNATLGMDAVLTHCDLWAANILWRKDSKDEDYQVAAVIDFQSLKYENGALDLMRIMMQLRPEVRRKEWENILETFYSYINEDCKDRVPYTLEQAVPALLQKTRCLFEDMFKHHRDQKVQEL